MTAPPVPLPETPDPHGAFPRLDDQQIEALAAHGERRPTRAGEVLYREGDEECDFIVVPAGEGGGRRAGRRPGARALRARPRRFLGELVLLTGQAAS